MAITDTKSDTSKPKSNLPRELRRKKAATPNIMLPEPVIERTTGGMEP